MIKQLAIAFTAVFAFASYSFAAYPANSPLLSDAPSVLIKADVPADVVADASADVSAIAPVDTAAIIANDAVEAAVVPDAEPIAVDSVISQSVSAEGVVIESAPTPISENPPVYRVVRPSRRSNGGLFSELIELEKRKNAWLKKNLLGR